MSSLRTRTFPSSQPPNREETKVRATRAKARRRLVFISSKASVGSELVSVIRNPRMSRASALSCPRAPGEGSGVAEHSGPKLHGRSQCSGLSMFCEEDSISFLLPRFIEVIEVEAI